MSNPPQIEQAHEDIERAIGRLVQLAQAYHGCDEVLEMALLAQCQVLRAIQTHTWRAWHDHCQPNL